MHKNSLSNTCLLLSFILPPNLRDFLSFYIIFHFRFGMIKDKRSDTWSCLHCEVTVQPLRLLLDNELLNCNCCKLWHKTFYFFRNKHIRTCIRTPDVPEFLVFIPESYPVKGLLVVWRQSESSCESCRDHKRRLLKRVWCAYNDLWLIQPNSLLKHRENGFHHFHTGKIFLCCLLLRLCQLSHVFSQGLYKLCCISFILNMSNSLNVKWCHMRAFLSLVTLRFFLADFNIFSSSRLKRCRIICRSFWYYFYGRGLTRLRKNGKKRLENSKYGPFFDIWFMMITSLIT